MPNVQRIAESDPLLSTRVEVVEACGEWFVHVVENGRDRTRSFDIEAFALNYAEGQCSRLNLKEFLRI